MHKAHKVNNIFLLCDLGAFFVNSVVFLFIKTFAEPVPTPC